MSEMQQILKDEQLDKRLLNEGYVVVPFLDAVEVSALLTFYYGHHTRSQEGMYATAHVPDIDFRIKMNDLIKKVFARAIERFFVNYTALGGSFIAKGKGTNGKLHPHQDWNIVDEEQFRSFNIWVPLVDLHQNNGAIQVLPHSHTWLTTFRSANITGAYSQVNDLLLQKMAPLYMKAGEALIYDHRLLHASGENTTDEIRLAAVYGIITDNSSMRYYHQADEKTIEVFESNPEFFLYGNIFEGPKGLKSLGKFEHNFPQVTTSQLKHFLDPAYTPAVNLPPKPSLFKRLRHLLNA